MKYSLTPGLVFSLVLIAGSIYYLTVDQTYSSVVSIYFAFFGVIGVLADLVLQILFNNRRWLWVIEAIAIFLILLLNTNIFGKF